MGVAFLMKATSLKCEHLCADLAHPTSAVHLRHRYRGVLKANSTPNIVHFARATPMLDPPPDTYRDSTSAEDLKHSINTHVGLYKLWNGHQSSEIHQTQGTQFEKNWKYLVMVYRARPKINKEKSEKNCGIHGRRWYINVRLQIINQNRQTSSPIS